MQSIIRFILSPMAFALGFLWPLVTQLLIATALVPAGGSAIAIGAAVAVPWGLMAQFRGSWLWIR